MKPINKTYLIAKEYNMVKSHIHAPSNTQKWYFKRTILFENLKQEELIVFFYFFYASL